MTGTNTPCRPLCPMVSTADKGQTIENQLQLQQEAAERLGWTVMAIYRDEGISGTKGRQQRPGLDALLRGVARREFDIVAAWSVCRLGRSLPGPDRPAGVSFEHERLIFTCTSRRSDTSTPSGRMLFGMLSVFSEFERAIRSVIECSRGCIVVARSIWQAACAGHRFDILPGSSVCVVRLMRAVAFERQHDC